MPRTAAVEETATAGAKGRRKIRCLIRAVEEGGLVPVWNTTLGPLTFAVETQRYEPDPEKPGSMRGIPVAGHVMEADDDEIARAMDEAGKHFVRWNAPPGPNRRRCRILTPPAKRPPASRK
jgi:hypothetical protein